MYDIACKSCSRESVIFRRIAEYNNLPACSTCGGETFRKISAPAVQTDIEPFLSPASGRQITSKASLRDELARTNCFLPEAGIEKDIARWGQESRERAFKPIEKGVDAVVSQLVATGQIES